MGFLGKARKMIGVGGAVEPPKPQYYQVACAEGHVIRGERIEGYQALRCPHCGDGVFVLPKSPLPMPPAPSGGARRKSRPSAVTMASFEDAPIELRDAPPQDDMDEIQWLDPEPIVKSAPPPAPAKARPATPRPRPRPVPAPEPVDAGPPQDEPGEPPVRVRRRRQEPAIETRDEAVATIEAPGAMHGKIAVKTRPRRRGRIGLILAGVAVLSVATIAYRSWRQRLQELPHIAEVTGTEGTAALERGQFDEAKAKLARAASAYKALGATDETASRIIQYASEAAILADLAHDTLPEIVEEVARLGDPAGIDKFNSIHADRSILIESEIKSVGKVIELEYRIFVGRGPVAAKEGTLDLKGFEFFKTADMKPGDHVLFGARLDSIRLDDGVWKIKLSPDSGVAMTNAKALAIGLNEAAPEASP